MEKQGGVVWWGKARLENGRFRCVAEPGTRFVAVARLAGRSGPVIGTFTAALGPVSLQWARGLVGQAGLRVQVLAPTSLDRRQLDVSLVPLLDDGSRIQARSAWRSAKVRPVGEVDAKALVAGFRDLAPGRYEVQVSVERRVKVRETVQVPCDDPVMVIGGVASVLFSLGAQDGVSSECRLDVRYAPLAAPEAVQETRLPTGIGGFEGYAVHDLAPGDYEFCLRCGDHYGEGRFRVQPGDVIIEASCPSVGMESVVGTLAPGARGPGRLVGVVGSRIAGPWLSANVDESGGFRIEVPAPYLNRELCLFFEGNRWPLVLNAEGQWDVKR